MCISASYQPADVSPGITRHVDWYVRAAPQCNGCGVDSEALTTSGAAPGVWPCGEGHGCGARH